MYKIKTSIYSCTPKCQTFKSGFAAFDNYYGVPVIQCFLNCKHKSYLTVDPPVYIFYMQLFVCHLLVLIISLRNNLLFPDKNLVSKPKSTGATGTWKGGAVPSTKTAAGRPSQVSFHPAAPHEGTRRRCDHHHWDSIQGTRPSRPTQLSSSQGYRPSVNVWQPYRDHWNHSGRYRKYPAKSPYKHLLLSGGLWQPTSLRQYAGDSAKMPYSPPQRLGD